MAIKSTSNRAALRAFVSPIAYIADGVEYIAINGDAFYRSGDFTGNTLCVFVLPR